MTIWAVISVIYIARLGGEYNDAVRWFSSPINNFLLVIFFPLVFSFAYFSGKVVIEDYVHEKRAKFITLFTMKILFVLAGLVGIYSALQLYFW